MGQSHFNVVVFKTLLGVLQVKQVTESLHVKQWYEHFWHCKVEF